MFEWLEACEKIFQEMNFLNELALILKCIRKVSYELALIHLVYHVSMLKKLIWDPTSTTHLEGLGFDKGLSYQEVLEEILDQKVKQLRKLE